MAKNKYSGVARWAAALISVATVGAGVYVTALTNSGVGGPGDHSAFTRTELRTNWDHPDEFRLLLPTTMPAGAEKHPEVGFRLTNVVTDPLNEQPRRVWVSYYESDALGNVGASFRVFQRPRSMAESEPCGPMGASTPVVTRELDGATLSICGLDLESELARDYWEKVAFTSDLSDVSWLRD